MLWPDDMNPHRVRSPREGALHVARVPLKADKPGKLEVRVNEVANGGFELNVPIHVIAVSYM